MHDNNVRLVNRRREKVLPLLNKNIGAKFSCTGNCVAFLCVDIRRCPSFQAESDWSKLIQVLVVIWPKDCTSALRHSCKSLKNFA